MSTNCKCGRPVTHRVVADTDNGRKQIRVCRAHLEKATKLAARKLHEGTFRNYAIEEL